MSDPTYQTKNYGRQGGSVWTIDSGGREEVLSGGTFRVASGGSVQIESGGVFNVASGGSLTMTGGLSADSLVVGTLTLGGTQGRWAFGSTTLASGTALVFTGLGQIIHAEASYLAPLSAGTGAGSATSFQVNPTRFANGTAYFLGLTGTSAFTGAGTITWAAFGL